MCRNRPPAGRSEPHPNGSRRIVKTRGYCIYLTRVVESAIYHRERGEGNVATLEYTNKNLGLCAPYA
jgi:hypothetical protein